MNWPVIKRWVRNCWCDLPGAVFDGFRKEGFKGAWLGMCVFFLRCWPFPMTFRGMRLERFAEAVNFFDNFIHGEMRDGLVEADLRRAGGRVVELGVNIGITTRWWLQMHPETTVTGVDMMEESIDYTTTVTNRQGDGLRWQGLVAAVGPEAGEVEVRFTDPLEGTNSLGAAGSRSRKVRLATLDELIPEPGPVVLLKVDIEGAGGGALRGARRLLAATRHVVVETHGEDETVTASRCLQEAGFTLRRISGRSMWWSRPPGLS